MRAFYQVAAFLRGLFRSADIDREMAEELRFHIDKEMETQMRFGASPESARRAARLKLGSVDAAQEASRDERPGSRIRQFARDVVFGARLLRKSFAFTAATIGIVALGVGAVTAIFSVVYGVMLKPLPYAEPDRLVSVWSVMPKLNLARASVSAADFMDFRASSRVFDDLALVRTNGNFNLVGEGGEPERLQGARTSANLLKVLGVRPLLGRPFTEEEQRSGNENVALLSYGLWQRRYAGDRAIVGRMILLNGVPTTVVGVMGESFQYPSRDFQIWIPVSIDPRELTRETTQNYQVVGRLKRGVTLEQAQRDMTGIARRIEQKNPQTDAGVGVLVVSMLADAVRPVRGPLYLLLAAVGCLLAIACLNVANLLGARSASRSSEFAVRLALGASRGRLTLQALAEVLPILIVGGTLGVLLAAWAVQLFVASAPVGLPRIENVELSGPVLVAALGVLTLSGLVASLLPASQAWRADFTTVTKESSRSAAGGRRHTRARRALVVAQIAFAVPLLVGTGILARSFARLTDVQPGIRTANVLSMAIAVPRMKYSSDEQVAAYETRLIDAMRVVPGVAAVGMVNRLPLSGNGQVGSLELDNGTPTPTVLTVDWRSATPDYFATMSIPLVQGRAFTAQDDMHAPLVGVIDERLARMAWPGQSPIGHRFRIPGAPWHEIVGVVGHVRHDGLDADPRPQVYWSYLQRTQDRMAIVARTNASAASLTSALTAAIHTVDADQPVYDVRTMDAVLDRSLSQRKLTMVLIGVFGAAALVLASVGVYGVVAFGVTQRLREFGIRVALGAERGAVTRLVVGQGAALAVVGTAIGLVVAIAAAGAMKGMTYETNPRDPLVFGGASLVLIGVAAVASWFPARRAASVDPAVTLRAE